MARPSASSRARQKTVAGKAIELKKNRACDADGREHDKNRHGNKQTALSPKAPAFLGTRFCAGFFLAF
jgi:hypothetical protein